MQSKCLRESLQPELQHNGSRDRVVVSVQLLEQYRKSCNVGSSKVAAWATGLVAPAALQMRSSAHLTCTASGWGASFEAFALS